MTRINCIPVEELVSKHLIAEYRELPRIYRLVKDRVAKGQTPSDINVPDNYTLGTGHVLFFFNKLEWVTERYKQLCLEMHKRGYAVNYGDHTELCVGIPKEWFGNYKADKKALDINRERIALRVSEFKTERRNV